MAAFRQSWRYIEMKNFTVTTFLPNYHNFRNRRQDSMYIFISLIFGSDPKFTKNTNKIQLKLQKFQTFSIIKYYKKNIIVSQKWKYKNQIQGFSVVFVNSSNSAGVKFSLSIPTRIHSSSIWSEDSFGISEDSGTSSGSLPNFSNIFIHVISSFSIEFWKFQTSL